MVLIFASGAGIVIAFMLFMRFMVWFNVAHDGFNTADRSQLSKLQPTTYGNAPGETSQQ